MIINKRRLGAAVVAALLVASTLPASSASLQTPRASSFKVLRTPPPGMALTTGQPTNRLMLQAKYDLRPQYLRQVVLYDSHEKPGTIVINSSKRYLYLVLPHGRALRYGIGVARSGFEWTGTHKITNKREWPGWTPPTEMRKRQPELPAFMPGGLDNPLGARALYIGSTLYRIHGTTQPWTIGGTVSSGCIRLTNADVTDLYTRVKIGAKVVVL